MILLFYTEDILPCGCTICSFFRAFTSNIRYTMLQYSSLQEKHYGKGLMQWKEVQHFGQPEVD